MVKKKWPKFLYRTFKNMFFHFNLILIIFTSSIVAFDEVTFDANDVFLKNCRLGRFSSAPNLFQNQSVLITVTMGPDRIIEINDISESFRMMASIQLTYSTNCIKKLTSDPTKWPTHLKFIQPKIDLDPDRFWRPQFLVRNAVEDQGLEREFKQVYAFNQIFQEMMIDYGGTFHLYCDFDFYFYPLDKQTCGLVIFFYDSHKVAKIISANFSHINESPMPANSMWLLVSNETLLEYNNFGGLEFSQVKFLFHFQRQPNWHFLNLFGPSFIFCILELASFLIPGDEPDRAAYNVTILLAFTVLHGSIVSSIPATPKPVIVQYYIFFEMVYSMLVTIYSCALCWFLNHLPKKADRQVLKFLYGGLKTWQLVDASAFAFAMFLLTMLNGFAFAMIYSNN